MIIAPNIRVLTPALLKSLQVGNPEKLKVGFVYGFEPVDIHGRIKMDECEYVHNLMPEEARDSMLNAFFKSGTTYATFYLGLQGASWTVSDSDGMTELIASADEIQDYSGTARQSITFPAVSGGILTTSAAPNTFTFTAATTLYGSFITTTSAWDSDTGLLVSSVQLASSKSFEIGESVRVPVTFTLTSS